MTHNYIQTCCNGSAMWEKSKKADDANNISRKLACNWKNAKNVDGDVTNSSNIYMN